MILSCVSSYYFFNLSLLNIYYDQALLQTLCMRCISINSHCNAMTYGYDFPYI